MVSLFLLRGCNLSYIVDLLAALHELASATARTLLKLASSVGALLKPYGDALRREMVLLFIQNISPFLIGQNRTHNSLKPAAVNQILNQ